MRTGYHFQLRKGLLYTGRTVNWRWNAGNIQEECAESDCCPRRSTGGQYTRWSLRSVVRLQIITHEPTHNIPPLCALHFAPLYFILSGCAPAHTYLNCVFGLHRWWFFFFNNWFLVGPVSYTYLYGCVTFCLWNLLFCCWPSDHIVYSLKRLTPLMTCGCGVFRIFVCMCGMDDILNTDTIHFDFDIFKTIFVNVFDRHCVFLYDSIILDFVLRM